MDISIIQVFKAIAKRWWTIVISGICCAALFFAFCMLTSFPTFTSSVKLYVITQNGDNISPAEIADNAELVATYIEILKSQTVLSGVAENISELGYTSEDILGMIRASQVGTTPIFKFSVTCSNPEEAQLIAYEVANVAAPRIKDIVGAGDVKIVDDASVAQMKAPNYLQFALIGLIVGILIPCVIIAVIVIFDRRIKLEADISEVTQYPVIGIIPKI